jgi:hypothetical protein
MPYAITVFLHHLAFAPHALHLVLFRSFILVYARSCGVRNRDLRGESPRGVQRYTSVKWRGY